jgi:phosphoribosyl 1,2-cyclic phosphate phosphodiesterase
MADALVEVIVLGTGTSHGVPMIGCECPVCTSNDPHDKRTRPSIWVRYGGVRFLVDTSPELRLQCLANGIREVDAVLFTHHHADHVAGLDDLRRFNWMTKKAVPCYGTERTLAGIQRMFSYAFERDPNSPHSRPELDLHIIKCDPFEVNGVGIIPIPLMHGPLPVLGFRFGPFAYCTDCSTIPEDSISLLRGVEVLILDALRHDPHPTHLSLKQAVDLATRIGASRTYFTHMAHQLKHAETDATLPSGMALAHDGLKILVE